jgi:hypothetical protein
MTSPDFRRKKVADLKQEEAKLRQSEAKYTQDAGKKRGEAARKRESARRTSSVSSKQRYEREAAKLEEEAGKLAVKAAAESSKLATNLSNQRQAQRSLEQAEASVLSRQKQDTDRRQRQEIVHGRTLARVSVPVVRYIHEVRSVQEPRREPLRVAYLTANPRVTEVDPETGDQLVTRIRVDKEVRDVKEEVRRSSRRDEIDIQPWVGATAMDVLNALNEQKPHVMHFSGHAGQGLLEFDDGQLDPESQDVSLAHLARALAATNQAPQVIVLNACETLEGAEVLLPAVPVVIATSSTITDLAANIFAVRFYAAIASGQSLGHAVEQARFAMDVLAGGSGGVIQTLTRADVEINNLVLIDTPDDVSDAEPSPS